MIYKQLLETLQRMNEQQLNLPVQILSETDAGCFLDKDLWSFNIPDDNELEEQSGYLSIVALAKQFAEAQEWRESLWVEIPQTARTSALRLRFFSTVK